MGDIYTGMAKVASQINDFDFVINKGGEDGVAIGTNFLVFRLGDAILDPDTGENLGRLELVIGRAKVVHVQSRIATLRSSESINLPGRVRTVRREAAKTGLAAWINSPSVEEVEEGAKTEMKKIFVQPGDLLRPI